MTRIAYQFEYPGTNFQNHPKEVVFRFFDSEQSLIAAIITDQVDFALTESRFAAMEVEKSTLAYRIHFRYKLPNYVKLLAYNNENPLLKDSVIRKALTYAIDRNYIIERLLNQSAYSADGPLSKEAQLHSTNLDEYDYNPRKAQQLLAAENWEDVNNDGILEKNGKPFRLVLTYEKGALLDEQIVRLIKIEWSKLGIDVTRNPLIKSEIKQVMKQRDYDVLLMNYQFHETIESFEDFFQSSGPNNILNYASDRVDRYFQRYRLVPKQSQKEIFKEGIQIEINKDHPAAFLFFLWLDHYFVNRSKFRNFQDSKGKLLPFTDWILIK
ncbi:MAG: ABC transporter substrate-binding protein [Candidatus Zhuqueibacterota bacterium]